MTRELLKSFDHNNKGRDIVVGDIHGHYTRLMRSLRYINFNPKVDRLFCCGDLIDRGPENEKILYDLIVEPWFHPVIGNHEQMLVQVAGMSERDLLENVELRKEIIANGGAWYLGLTRIERLVCSDIVYDLPIAIQISDNIGQAVTGIVHANAPCKTWSEFRDVLHQGEITKEFKNHCLWSKLSDVENHWRSQPITDINHIFVGHNVFRASIESPWQHPGLVRCDAGAWHKTTSEDCLFMLFDAISGECLIPQSLWPDWIKQTALSVPHLA